MKLIIDISDKTYKIIKNMVYFYNSQRSGKGITKEILTAIKQGTPLPKGHGDLIDRNQILQGEHFVILGDVQVEDENFGEREFDMFPKQTIMSVKPIIEADKVESEK